MEREHSLIFILLSRYFHLPQWADTAIMAGIAILIIFIVVFLATRRLSLFSPSRPQAGLELGVSALENFVGENLRKEEAEFFASFLASLFIYILILNLLSVIPGFSPRASIVYLLIYCSICWKVGILGAMKAIAITRA